ncbi:titin-like isoform X1 [Dendronephthya gigantea]|uniref:titin-like isoform X1 n=1 Tax=Dendronephthya gigantea TaxID=151771 RepID=UPI00106A9078|nr:titin-like isoform X1 [Dendronephthya gigantea]
MPNSSESLYISWKPPVILNGIITTYELRLCLTRDGNGNDFEPCVHHLSNIALPANARNFNATKLCAFCKYRIQLRAKTIKFGEFVSTTGRTKESVSSEPTKVSLTPLSHHQLRLSWKAPSNKNGNITGYKITWKIVGNDTNHPVDGELKTKIVRDDVLSFDITNLTAHSEYIVTVNAINGAGNGLIVTKMACTNEHVPSAPTNVKIISVSSSQLNITWQPPADPNGVITGYYITWRMIKNDLNQSVSVLTRISSALSAKTRMHSIQNLEPYSVYNLSLNAQTRIGNGPQVFVKSRTKQSLPGEPGSVQLIPVSETVLNLTWKSPSDPNGIIIGYRVIWEMIEDDKNMSVSQNSRVRVINDGTAVSYQIEGLAAYSVYNVSLNAITSIGNGSKVNVTSRTNESLPGEPGNVQVIPVSATVLNLTWKSPSDPNGIIIGYRVIWEMIEDDKNMSVSQNSRVRVINDGTAVSYQIEGLAAYSVYNVSLNAITSIGNGSKVNVTSRTNESLPGEPGNVQVIPVSATVLNLTWKSPSDPNGIIIGYRVIWEMIEDDNKNTFVPQNSTVKIINDGSAVSYPIENLAAYSVYNVSLNAITSIGNGSKVHVTSRTNESLPSAPASVKIISVSSSQLNITWQPPADPNGVITGYYITWRMIKNDLDQSVNVLTRISSALSAKTRMHSIQNLEPYSVYNLSLNAQTRIGNGPQVFVKSRTKQSLPGEPGSVQLIPVSETVLNLTWKSPSDPNGIIIGYRVIWEMIEDDKNMSVSQNSRVRVINDGTAVSYQIEGLAAYSVYNVSLNAITSIGNGSKVNVTSRTNESLPGEPGNVQLIPVSATVLNLTWKSPSDPNGIIIGYRVIWEMIEDDNKNTHVPRYSSVKIINDGNAMSDQIENLAAYSVYNVSLNAITSIGNGSKVHVTSRTNESLPSAPASVKIISVSSSQLNITWQPPADPNGVITGYYITWRMIKNDLDQSVNVLTRISSALSAKTRMHSIQNLEPYSVYNVSLNAQTRIGNGPQVFVKYRTKQSLPGEPGSVQLISVSATVLNLTWKSPSDPNGIIIGYRVIWEMIEDDNKNTHLPRYSSVKIINNGNTVSYPIEGLAAFSVYNVSLNAITSIGNGSKVYVTSRTNESLPGEPGNVQLIPVSATVLNLTWESPSDPNGIIIGYRVIWEMIEDDKNMSVPQNSRVRIINDGTAVSYQIKKLEPYSVYIVSINAITRIGNGSAVYVASRTKQSLPGKPQRVQLISISENVLNLSWDSPSDPNGVITGYRIGWRMIKDDKNVTSINVLRTEIVIDGTKKSFQIDELEPYSEYNVSLNAITSIGNGSKVFVTSRTNQSRPAYLFVTPKTPTVFENSSVILSCNCGCKILPYWFKENQQIHYDEPGTPYVLLSNGSLYVNVSRDTAGNYSCEIRTSFWSVASMKVELKVWYLDDCYVTGDRNLHQGENISLSCHTDGVPYPAVTWYFKGEPIAQNSRILIKGNHLKIFNASINDDGDYSCVASNQVGKVSQLIHIRVKGIPSVKISTYISKYIVEGTDMQFTCHREDWISIQHIQIVELVKDGIPLFKWRWRGSNISTPVINARQNYTGRYQCKATIGAASRFSAPFILTIGISSGPVVLEEDPKTSATGVKISWKPISKRFWSGEQVTFEVNVSSVDHILKKSHLTKTTGAIFSGLRPKTTYIVSITGRTVFGRFQNVTVIFVTTKENKNNMKYQLSIRLIDYKFSNKLLDETSSQYKNLKFRLENSLTDIFKKSEIGFHYISSWVFSFQKGSVVVLVVVSLDTQFREDPKKLVKELNKANTIAGYRFDKLYTREKDFDECAKKEFNSCHEYAHCENAVGTYLCDCFKGFFGDGKECKGPPQITSRSPSNITQFVETNVTLVCNVIADPHPIILWKRAASDGKFVELKRTSEKSDGNFTIFNARLEDSGTYQCHASNPLGYDSYTTKVIIKPVIVDIDVEIKLSNKTFVEDLKNKSSPTYKKLENDVYTELYNFFNNTPGFEDIEILGFTNGSVKVIFRVIVKVLKPSKESNDVVAVKIGRKINKQLKTGRIGNIQVVPGAIKLKVPPPPPANVTYSDIKETRVHIYWEPPELHEMFSIEQYYITYLKYGSKIWSNNTINAEQLTNTQLDNLESDTFYIIIIIAENAYGLGKKSSRMEIKTKKVEVIPLWYYIGPIIGLAGVVVLLMIIYVTRRVFHSDVWKLEDRKSDSNRREVKTSFQMIERENEKENTYQNVAFSDGEMNSAWKEILRNLIRISDEVLIPGNFNFQVVRGTIFSPLEEKRTACSVKLLKENAKVIDHNDLMNELTTISAVSVHENIMNLIGACTSKDGPLLLVLEFCSRGTLESNLREKKKNKQMLTKKTKIQIAKEIAKGMTHLTNSGIVHQDLAARNILLTDDFTPKISNFGVSRDTYKRGSYHNISQQNLAVRWLAIEALTNGLYTTKSDVWSFAVVMWEIETRGCTPYQEFDVEDFVSHVREGYRLSQPDETSSETYNFMLQCWDANPNHRPTFHEVVNILEELLRNNKVC